MKLPTKAILIAILPLLLPFSVYAAEVRLAEKYTLPPSDRIFSNLYAASQSAVISGEIWGDIVLASGDIVFSGKGNNDAIFLGGTVESLGLIMGDLRVASLKLIVSGGVGGDAVLTGGSVQILPGVLIKGDVVIVGGNVSISGNVLGDVYVAGGNILIDGRIAGNVKIYSVGKIELADKAHIGGDIVYYSGAEAKISDSADVLGEVYYTFSTPMIFSSDIKGFMSILFGWFFLVRLLVMAASVMVFVLVFRRLSAELVRISVGSFWKTSLVGFATAIAIPFASIFLMITVLGGAIGAVLLSVGFTMAIVAKVYSGVVFGYLCSKYLFKEDLPDIISWKMALVGTLAAHVVFLVPYLGLAVLALLYVNAFGAVSSLAYKHFFTSR